MTSVANKTRPSRRLLRLRIGAIKQRARQPSCIRRSGRHHRDIDIPTRRSATSRAIVVDINLRSAESVQLVRNKLRAEAYREMPRLFVLADRAASRIDAGLGARRHRHHRAAVRPRKASCSDSRRVFRTATDLTRPIAARS